MREIDSIPWIHNDKWKKDEEFGRQILNGINPCSIEKVKERLPENFPVSDSHVNGLLCRGISLQEEINRGNIYIVNHKVCRIIKSQSCNFYSLCLFYYQLY